VPFIDTPVEETSALVVFSSADTIVSAVNVIAAGLLVSVFTVKVPTISDPFR
jgi:hypothetical protein